MGIVFHEDHYKDYCRQISEHDLSSIKDTLGIELQDESAIVPLFGEEYLVSGKGITDKSGNRPGYLICVVLAKYLLLCPQAPSVNEEWSTLTDLNSQFTNVNVFKSDAERPIIQSFTGKVNALIEAAGKLGCKPSKMDTIYDVSMEINALPKIKILLLFNDGDEEFPASTSILYQRHAGEYLDPESLIMIGMTFTKLLKTLAE
ncbi:DUF3786 domain-containing protein [Desulfospira joergensenii]|uniref:DUF3786 domain-containing protein n=1 Tax=Desulfospira joergensenii TaxID=53329 RepID=UPI0003B7A370|nr:DUF3786 domain-containing protein [Desulfospira joergensenii]